jgi:hypothetical protein
MPAAMAHDRKRTDAILTHIRQFHRFGLVLIRPRLHHSTSRAQIMAGLFGF